MCVCIVRHRTFVLFVMCCFIQTQIVLTKKPTLFSSWIHLSVYGHRTLIANWTLSINFLDHFKLTEIIYKLGSSRSATHSVWSSILTSTKIGLHCQMR